MATAKKTTIKKSTRIPRLTKKEAARIQAFPDKFKFSGSDADAYRQIGNAIPPVLMWYVCNSILELTYS